MFGVITAYTGSPEVKILGDMTSANKSDYCKRHKYKFFEFGADYPKDLSKGFGWMKLPLIRKCMVENPDIKWFFWIDADAIIMNHRTKLESLIDEWAYFIVGRDCNGINVGTFLVKNCQKSLDFLDAVWARGPQPGNWWTISEQGQIDYMSIQDKFRNGFSVVSNKKFNAYIHDCSPGWLPCARYEPGDFCIHMPGISDKERHMAILLKHVIT